MIDLRLPRLGRNTPPGMRLALTGVAGNVTHTASTMTVWFTIPDLIWPYRSDNAREAVLDAMAVQYAELAGLQLHLRRTTVPFPVDVWAHAYDNRAKPLPDASAPAPGAGRAVAPMPRAAVSTWGRHLGNVRDHLANGQYSLSRVHLGVTMPRREPATFASLARRGRPAAGDTDRARRLVEIAETLAGASGLRARPATPGEVAWLIYRSVGLGLTPPVHRPGDVGPDDIAEFTENIDLVRGPYDSTTQLVDRRTGQIAHTAVVTVSRMDEVRVPQQHQPWGYLSATLPFDVEWSSHVDVLGPQAAQGKVEQRLRMIRSQQREYDRHGLDSPPSLEALADRARDIGNEMETGRPEIASRVHGWHRMAVSASTKEECLARVRELIRHYNTKAKISVVHPRGQLELLQEFVPGQRVVDTRFIRRQPVKMFAAAVPHASGAVGDNRGDLIGYTVGGAVRPVFFDMHFPQMVRERSGLTVLVAEPGAGKSTLLGGLSYLAARRGVQVTLMDPSGPLARLATLPELRKHTRVINLSQAAPGTLAPYAMVPTPDRATFAPGAIGDSEYASAVANARAERKELVLDILTMLLPPTHSGKAEIIEVLYEAVRNVQAVEQATLEDVIAGLWALARADSSDNPAAAKTAAGLLSDISELPQARVFFGTPPAGTLRADNAITIITMAGLHLPNMNVDRRDWSKSEQLTVPMLHLAHRLAVRRCYGGDMKTRKMVGLDEAHFMAGWKSGKAFLDRLSRDSRKWNMAAFVASQNPADVLGLDLQNLTVTAFAGRIAEDPVITAEACRLLRIDAGFQNILASLSLQGDHESTDRLGYRDFLMRDVDDRVQQVRIDFSYLPGLLQALDTTPGGAL